MMCDAFELASGNELWSLHHCCRERELALTLGTPRMCSRFKLYIIDDLDCDQDRAATYDFVAAMLFAVS